MLGLVFAASVVVQEETSLSAHIHEHSAQSSRVGLGGGFT